MNYECKRIVGIHEEYAGDEIDRSPIYSCEYCDECECDEWKDYNDTI